MHLNVGDSVSDFGDSGMGVSMCFTAGGISFMIGAAWTRFTIAILRRL